MRIGWVVDHPKRDLAGSVLAAYQLALRGASVVIVPMYEQGVDVPRLGLDALVANYACDANLDLMRSFPKPACASISWTPKAACRRRIGRDVFDLVDAGVHEHSRDLERRLIERITIERITISPALYLPYVETGNGTAEPLTQ